ncbi:MAG: hypothetical protein LBI84_06645 [Propionibacteriaceae bacterium]|jgi:hypothetical protein|nr:hypothetical protein [Propionibacteriaceae bacterium]
MSESAFFYGNRIGFGGNVNNVTAVGGDNHGTINHITTTNPDDQPKHERHAEKRWATPITDRLMLILNVVMAICSVLSFTVGIVPLVEKLSQGGVKSLGAVPQTAFWAATFGVILLTLALVGWVFRRWLRTRTYADRVILGRVPEGRLDPRGRYRLNATKLRGICAIDGSKMRPARVPTGKTPIYMADGTIKTKPSGYELQMRCSRGGQHSVKVDLSDTEE